VANESSRALPELSRLHNVDSLEGAEREQILVYGNQDVSVGGNRRSKNRNILRVSANTRREFGRLYQPKRQRSVISFLGNLNFSSSFLATSSTMKSEMIQSW
jgi:hypothetical protein